MEVDYTERSEFCTEFVEGTILVPKESCAIDTLELVEFLPQSDLNYWAVVKRSLLELIQILKSDPKCNLTAEISKCISKYRTELQTLGYLDSQNLEKAFEKFNENSKFELSSTDVVIWMAENAIKLDTIDFMKLPRLTSKETKEISLFVRDASIILCNGFFCTYLYRDQHDNKKFSNYPRINFIRLFTSDTSSFNRNDVKIEKLLCLLAYFECSARQLKKVSLRLVTFKRQHNDHKCHWETLQQRFISQPNFSIGSCIEDDHESLQVDFANKYVGGGVLGNGSVQEEIRFITCPELIVAQLFTEALTDDDVLFITGAKPFSVHKGYANTFRFEGPASPESAPEVSRGFQLVAMDALHFRPESAEEQYKKEFVDRELHKCFLGFKAHSEDEPKPISSGKWGCGAFGGDPYLKLLLQWIAATAHERSITFHVPDTSQDRSLVDKLEMLTKLVTDKNLNVSQLYLMIISYEKSPAEYLRENLEDFLLKEINKIFKDRIVSHL